MISDRGDGGATLFTGDVRDEPERFDLIIVGTGSGNAIPDYLADWKIAVVERDVFGGTCINRGCVPSKMFVLPADVAHDARHSARLGLDVKVGDADWGAIRDRVFGRIDPISVDGREYRAGFVSQFELKRSEFGMTNALDMVGDAIGITVSFEAIRQAAGAAPPRR